MSPCSAVTQSSAPLAPPTWPGPAGAICITGWRPGLKLSSQLVAWPQPGPEKQLPSICLRGTFQIHDRLASPGSGLPSLELFIMDSRMTWNHLEEVGCESRLCGLRVGEPRYRQNFTKKEIESQHFPADWKWLGISGVQGSLVKWPLWWQEVEKVVVVGGHSLTSARLRKDLLPQARGFPGPWSKLSIQPDLRVDWKPVPVRAGRSLTDELDQWFSRCGPRSAAARPLGTL